MRQREGTEYAYGGAGNDTIYGNFGSDVLSGGEGDDLIFGGQDDDTLIGGAGNDSLFGNRDNDVLSGGPGRDYFYWDQFYGGDNVIADFSKEEGDRIYFQTGHNLDVAVPNGEDIVLTSQATGATLTVEGVTDIVTLAHGAYHLQWTSFAIRHGDFLSHSGF